MSTENDIERRVISERVENLLKALELKKEEEAISILRSLKTLGVTADLLKKTQIGIIVNGIRRNESNGEELKKIAREIICKWKNEIIYASDSTPLNSGSESAPKSPPAINTPKNGALPSQSSRESRLPRKRFLSESVPEPNAAKATSTGDKFRDKCVGLIYSAISTDRDPEPDGAHILRLAQEIERYTADEYDPNSGIYKSRIQSIRFNLRDRNNPELRDSIIRGELSCREFSKLTTQQMASAERKLSVEKAKKDAMNESVAASDTQAETDMFQCNNCKKRRCKYFQMQTRSSDEPMTTFVSCLNCGKRWKVVDPLPFLKLNPIATNPLQFC